ncbi:MAG: hypothetical protein ACRDR6_22245 [Pseudonocardiaceae bacterium]
MTEKIGTRGRPRVVLTWLCALTFVLAGCGARTASTAPASSAPSAAGCPQVQSASFDKTKFVLHAGLGFGAFHHFIYKPFKAGEFSSGSRGRLGRLVRAGLATAFTVHELRLAKQDAEANPTLCRDIAAPLEAAAAKLEGLSGPIRSGQVSGSDLDQVNTSVDQAQHGSSQAGVPADDQIPSVQQLHSA